MSGRPRCLIVHHSSAVGGGTISLLDVVDALSVDYDVVVVSPDAPSFLPDGVVRHGARHRPNEAPFPLFNHYNGGPTWFSRSFIWGAIKARRPDGWWQELLAAERPALVVLNTAVLMPLARVVRAAGIPVVALVRETFRSPDLRTWLLRRGLDRDADGIVYLSDYDRRQGRAHRAETAVVHDVVTAPTSQRAVPRDWQFAAHVPVVLFAGGSSPLKGLPELLTAFLAIPSGQVQLLLVGQMETKYGSRYDRHLQKLLRAAHRHGRVVIAGQLDDMSPAYRVADMVVFPARVPHQARPTYEAGLAGLPVIVPDFENTSEFVGDGVNGLRYPPNDVHALTDAIRRLASDAELRAELGRANRQRTEAGHDPTTEGRKLRSFVSGLLGPADPDAD